MTSTTSKTTVSRDGVVTSDGAIIGHVKKEMRQGICSRPWPIVNDGK